MYFKGIIRLYVLIEEKTQGRKRDKCGAFTDHRRYDSVCRGQRYVWDECASDLAHFLTGCCQGSLGGLGVCMSARKLVHACACM